MDKVLASETDTAYRWALTQLRIKLAALRYSESTQRAYYQSFRSFLAYVYPLPLHQVGKDQIYIYHTDLIKKKNISRSTQNQSINAIKFYLELCWARIGSFFNWSDRRRYKNYLKC